MSGLIVLRKRVYRRPVVGAMAQVRKSSQEETLSKGLLFLLVGPSGSGKSAIIERALADLPALDRYITYTTRPPRAHEADGQDYHFVSRDEFEDLKKRGKLVEWQEFYGHLYGSSTERLESLIDGDVDGIAAYDVLGSKELQTKFPTNVITIFIVPPSVEELRGRLAERYGRDTPEGRLRLQRFDMEMEHAGQFKYVVENIELEQAVADVEGIIRAERCARLAREYKTQRSRRRFMQSMKPL